VRKGDAALLARINQGLVAIRADGSYDRIYAKYLGLSAPPAAASAASK
jgi:polar amino acid transport system substrate-binding protein